MKDTVTEMMRNLLGINSRVDEAKNQISDLEYKEAKNNQSEQQEKRILKKEDSISSLCDNLKDPTFTSQVCQKKKRKSKKLEIFLKKKITKENFTNLVKKIDTEVQEAQRVPNKRESKRPTHPLEDTS